MDQQVVVVKSARGVGKTKAVQMMALVDSATAGLEKNTRLAYTRHLEEFIIWTLGNGRGFNRIAVQAWKQELMARLAPATVNQALSAIRRLASEGKYTWLPADVADGIIGVKNVLKSGRRVGHWLSPNQVKILFEATDPNSLKGAQERVVLAVLVGCALRREEAARLTFEHLQERDGVWLIADMTGKRNRVRSVPLAPWVKRLIDRWNDQAGLEFSGRVLRAVNKADRLNGPVRTHSGGTTNGGMTDKAVYKTVVAVADRAGIKDLGPHSLRRTWARRAYKQGFPLDQIQAILGHESIRTTEIYIGLRGLDLESPVYVTF